MERAKGTANRETQAYNTVRRIRIDCMNRLRRPALILALVGALLTPVLHGIVLIASQQAPLATPISALTQTPLGNLALLALLLFGGAQLLVGLALGMLDHGRLWPAARILVKGCGIAVWGLAYHFDQLPSGAAGANSSDPLWIVASLVGFAMGCLIPGLRRIAPRLGRFNLACLIAWVLLIPLAGLMGDGLIGGYERLVGLIYVSWIVGLCMGLLSLGQRQPPSVPL